MPWKYWRGRRLREGAAAIKLEFFLACEDEKLFIRLVRIRCSSKPLTTLRVLY